MATQNPLYTPRSFPHEISVDGKKAIIWGDTQSVSDIFGPLVKIPPVEPKLITVKIAARRCKRYPGDPGYTIPEVSAKRLNKVNPKRNGPLPGRAFTGSYYDTSNDDPVQQGRIYNFRIQGAWATLDTWMRAQATDDVMLWSPSGHPSYYGGGATAYATTENEEVTE
jgi:hypothetical protein